MLEFYLFRIKVFPSNQTDLFEDGKTKSRSDLLREAIEALPKAELKIGTVWHLGNLTTIDKSGIYFKLGRTTESTLEIYQDGNFLEEEFPTAPYTHVVLDVEVGLCAIAKKPKLSPTAKGIANRFIKLLNESQKQLKAEYSIGEINDPKDLISYLDKASSISRFWVTFSRTNPIDANELYVKPFQRLVDASGGKSGKAELKGEELKSEVLNEVIRSAAKTADDAGATFKVDESKSSVKKRLKGNAISIKHEDIVDKDELRKLMQKVREEYQGIR